MTPPSRTVTSADGTRIAVWSSGTGPPLLLVHGAMSDHRRWRITPLLEPHRTVHLMDRRGRGGSGDAASWSLDAEVADVVAVVTELARTSGTPVDLLGHSLGGLLALRAAARTDLVRRLVLYEPAVNEPAVPAELRERMEALLADGRPEDATVLLMREVVGMPEDEITGVRAQASWPARVEAAHTLPRELGTDLVLDPAEAASVAAPTLLLVGADSPAPAHEAARLLAVSLPASRTVVIDGQQHVADQFVPELFARLVLDFLLEADEP